ncbi:Mov34/MPN/PAD-1 family protein [Paenibacillus xylanexedens]|uniref:Mov34/MPN/PAD-1 family protein n=1 Tax=Paenibacillus xylanexedens TaxID=528191 RepID=UPI00119F9ECD|nr:Mov34/MPN/PAD-1 family protein [Paenibacillus xylanexedens]
MAALRGQQNTLYIPSSVEQEISEYMFHSLPQEACGVVLGEAAAGGIRISRFQPIRNVAPDPLHYFQLEQAEWIRCVFQEPTLIGVFHSHPRTEPFPSPEDILSLPTFASLLNVYLIGSPVHPSDTISHNKMKLHAYEIQSEAKTANQVNERIKHTLQPLQLCMT